MWYPLQYGFMSFFEVNNCAVSKLCARSQQLTASKDISAITLGIAELGSCCVGWVHSCWVHFLWEFPGCWNVVLAIFASSLSLADCVVKTTELAKCFPFLLTWVQFTEITQLLVEFFVVKDHLRDGVLDVDQALTTKYAEGVARCMHIAVDRGWFRLIWRKINDDVCGFHLPPYVTLSHL